MGVVLKVSDYDMTYYVTMCQECKWRMQLDTNEIEDIEFYQYINIECPNCGEYASYTLYEGA